MKLYEGNYEKRKEIVTGTKEAEGVDAGAATKGIPKFWLTSMQNHPEVSQFIEEADLPALEYLEDVSIAYHEKLQVRY
jgi:nucleosome assembly protein 1-like 1